MLIHHKKRYQELAKAFFKLTIAGIFIGLLKNYDWIIALALIIKIVSLIHKEIIVPETSKNWILLIGMLITGVGGVIGEKWGIHHGYWEYHHPIRSFPLWLPFAWMLAFYILYSIEKKMLLTFNEPKLQNKIILALLIALIFPAYGEIITIYLGVWTYYWPYQLFGVPFYAFAALVFIHMLIYLILHLVCKKYHIKDIVYN